MDWIQDLASMVDPPLVNSISWGGPESQFSAAELDLFSQEAITLANRGVTIMASSGDDGVSGNGCACTTPSDSNTYPYTPQGGSSWTGEGYFPNFPAANPFVTAVGATMGPNEGDPEVACQADNGGVITTGGGFSTYYATPSWQQNAVTTYFNSVSVGPHSPTSGYNPNGRGIPDVSMIGVNYQVIIDGAPIGLYGTSASSPVFAALVSLLNAYRLSINETSIGFLNPTLYAGGDNVTFFDSNTSIFNDITSGDNKCCAGSPAITVQCCASGFYTATG